MKSPVRNEQLFDKRVAFSLVFTIQKRENKSWGEKMASKNEMLVFLSLFLECKPALRPCLWEVVLSGFVVANHQVSLNLSHVEGMERALLCAKKNAVTEFNLSLVESFEGNETEDFKSPWEKCRDRKGSFESCFRCCCHLSWSLRLWLFRVSSLMSCFSLFILSLERNLWAYFWWINRRI